MFICVSPNPAIDKRLLIPSLTPGGVIRASHARGYPGGKSTHVAMVLRTLGASPHWIGFCGGSTGDELASGLTAIGIQPHPVRTEAQTRTNLEILDGRGVVTEILEPGGAPSERELAAFEKSCRELFALGAASAVVIFSGSLPPGMPPASYERLVSVAKEYGCQTFLDTGGEPLRMALAARPHFVKLNRDEAAAALGRTFNSIAAASAAVRQLLKLGATAAALSLGAEGMLFCEGDGAPVLFAPAPRLSVQSAVGSGDSAMAGFAYAMANKEKAEGAVRLAAACGAANCLADSPGAGHLADIRFFEGQITPQILPRER